MTPHPQAGFGGGHAPHLLLRPKGRGCRTGANVRPLQHLLRGDARQHTVIHTRPAAPTEALQRLFPPRCAFSSQLLLHVALDTAAVPGLPAILQSLRPKSFRGFCPHPAPARSIAHRVLLCAKPLVAATETETETQTQTKTREQAKSNRRAATQQSMCTTTVKRSNGQ